MTIPTLPDEMGRFGPFGGRFVPETLMTAVHELEREYRAAQADEAFQAELADLSHHFSGRPTALTMPRTSRVSSAAPTSISSART